MIDILKNRSYEVNATDALIKLKALCVDSYQWSTRNKNLLSVTAGVSLVSSFLSVTESSEVIIATLEVLFVICKNMGKG